MQLHLPPVSHRMQTAGERRNKQPFMKHEAILYCKQRQLHTQRLAIVNEPRGMGLDADVDLPRICMLTSRVAANRR